VSAARRRGERHDGGPKIPSHRHREPRSARALDGPLVRGDPQPRGAAPAGAHGTACASRDAEDPGRDGDAPGSRGARVPRSRQARRRGRFAWGAAPDARGDRAGRDALGERQGIEAAPGFGAIHLDAGGRRAGEHESRGDLARVRRSARRASSPLMGHVASTSGLVVDSDPPTYSSPGWWSRRAPILVSRLSEARSLGPGRRQAGHRLERRRHPASCDRDPRAGGTCWRSRTTDGSSRAWTRISAQGAGKPLPRCSPRGAPS
jgi:hypothetical protein